MRSCSQGPDTPARFGSGGGLGHHACWQSPPSGLPLHKAQGLVLPERGCPFSKLRDVPGSWPAYTGSPPGIPRGSLSLDAARPPALLTSLPVPTPLYTWGLGVCQDPGQPIRLPLRGSESPQKSCFQNSCVQSQDFIKKKKGEKQQKEEIMHSSTPAIHLSGPWVRWPGFSPSSAMTCCVTSGRRLPFSASEIPPL